jgi:hypothetical protein
VGIKSRIDSGKAPVEKPGADSLERGLRILARIIALQYIKSNHSKPDPERNQRSQIGQIEIGRDNNDH